MSAETEYRAVSLEIERRKARLSTLGTELEQSEAEMEQHQNAIAASVAAGGPDGERRAARAAADRLRVRVEELRRAIPMVVVEVEGLKERAGALRLTAAEESADAAEADYVAAVLAARELVAEFAPRGLEAYDWYHAAFYRAQEARREALRLAGAHPEDVYRAELRARVPVEGAQWGPVIEALALAAGSGYARAKLERFAIQQEREILYPMTGK